MQYTFHKPEHLCLRSEIEQLFSAGSSSMTIYPLRATFRFENYSGSGPRAKVLLSVSKRKLKHAIDRNRAKRQLREAYRLQKHILTDHMPANKGIHIVFIWLAENRVQTDVIKKRVASILQCISEKVNAE